MITTVQTWVWSSLYFQSCRHGTLYPQGKKYDNSKSTAVEGKTVGVEVMGGSLAVPWDQLSVDRVNSLLEKSTKDGTLLLRKWLHEAWRLEKQTIQGKVSRGTLTLTELASLQTGLDSKPDMALHHLSCCRCVAVFWATLLRFLILL